jgi:TM2 domain-containing membrane protein YozV
LSILVGAYGIDRIYLGDVGLGILKLLTCGGLGIWWFIDLFFISDLIRQKNYQTLMMM